MQVLTGTFLKSQRLAAASRIRQNSLRQSATLRFVGIYRVHCPRHPACTSSYSTPASIIFIAASWNHSLFSFLQTGNPSSPHPATAMPAQTLLKLPPELLRQILIHVDLPTITALTQTCHHFRNTFQDESLWKVYTLRRFRVSPHVTQSRRLKAAGDVSWRALYAHWHLQLRMPASRVSGATHVAFAKGIGQGGLIWVTVASTEDCRLVGGRLRMRVLVQNVWGGNGLELLIGSGLRFVLADGVSIDVDEGRCHIKDKSGLGRGASRVGGRKRRSGTAWDSELPFREAATRRTAGEYEAFVTECFVERAGGAVPYRHPTLLRKDDFVVLTVEILVPDAKFEVDALERLDSLHVPAVRIGGRYEVLVATFREKVLWDSYERLPGGWWVRRDDCSACRL